MEVPPAGSESLSSAAFGRDEITLDRLAGDWWIHQLRYGHRYASDDVLTAWAAVSALPAARRVLDLGAGVGAVGLLALLRLEAMARLTVVEVQEISVGLLRRTVCHNGIQDRVSIRHADLRNGAALPEEAFFDLITANPPYLPAARSSRSSHPQRAAARLELHGDVFDYCRVAARHLDPAGCFCFCHRADDGRPEEAVARAGLGLLSRREIVFREGRPPSIALFTCAREGGARRADAPPLVLRDRDGRRTDTYRAVRRAMWIEA
jgi:tRNA1Val (adenine37-N6)-methyltransferase